jgi:hypothetical protein
MSLLANAALYQSPGFTIRVPIDGMGTIQENVGSL